MKQKVKYLRISSGSQDFHRQSTDLDGFDKVYRDTESGTIPMEERKEGKLLLEQIKSGNVSELHITNVDRIARSVVELLSILQICSENNVNVVVQQFGLSSLTLDGKPNHIFSIVTNILSIVSSMERDNISERTKTGRLLAKARGVKFGRKGGRETVGKFLQKPAVERIIKTFQRKPSLTIREVALLNQCSTKLVLKVKKLTNPVVV